MPPARTGVPMFPQPKPPGYHQGANQALLAAVPAAARVVLDVGCGAGALGAALKRQAPGRVVIGVEADPSAAASARAVLDRVIEADPEAAAVPLPPGSVDCVVFGDVLEHLRDPEAALARHRPLLRPGGAAVCSVPNVRHQSVLAALLRGDFPYAPAGLLDATHLRFFTLASLCKLLLDAGYLPEPAGATAVPDDTPPDLASALDPAFRLLGVHPGRARAHLGAYQYVVRAYPLADPPAPTGPVTVVCCVADEAVLRDNLLASPDLAPGGPHEVLLFRGCRAAADGLNAGLDRARHRRVVLAHQDVYLPRGWFGRVETAVGRAEAAFGRVGAAGVYGTAGRSGPAARAGRVVDRDRLLWEPAPLPFRADVLDELVMVVDRDAGLRLDPALGFHLYGADLCLSAGRRGLVAAVVDAPCLHNSQTVELPPAFAASARALAAKWRPDLPLATPCAVVTPDGRATPW